MDPRRHKLLTPNDRLGDETVALRLAVRADCTHQYERWLADPEVNRYLETRWTPQPLGSIERFVDDMFESPDNYLFAIIAEGEHVGNIKLGPINWNHGFADVSYFLGERAAWGRGVATRAIQLVVAFGFTQVHLRRVQAGVYSTNLGSCRALEKAGFELEARLERKLQGRDGTEDHLCYRLLAPGA